MCVLGGSKEKKITGVCEEEKVVFIHLHFHSSGYIYFCITFSLCACACIYGCAVYVCLCVSGLHCIADVNKLNILTGSWALRLSGYDAVSSIKPQSHNKLQLTLHTCSLSGSAFSYDKLSLGGDSKIL